MTGLHRFDTTEQIPVNLDQVRRQRAAEMASIHVPAFCRANSCGAGYRSCSIAEAARLILAPGYDSSRAPVVKLYPPERGLYPRPLVGARFPRHRSAA